MKDTKYIIADNVKRYRKKEGITQIELAERAALSLDSIKRIEGGKRTMTLEKFLYLAYALGVSPLFLLYEDIDKIPEIERIYCVMQGKDEKQKKYLLNMFEKMAKEMKTLFS